MLRYLLFFGACIVSTMLSGTRAAGGFTSCSGSDCVTPYVFYDTQNNCTEEKAGPTHDCRWSAGLNFRVDEIILNGRIVAYKLQWFSGKWSGWFVPAYNDFDAKFNTVNTACSIPSPANGLRRAWSYFYDHTHLYIICRN